MDMQQQQVRSLLTGTVFLSTDPGSIPSAVSRGFYIVGLVEDRELQLRLRNTPNSAIFSSLLPSIHAVTAFLEQNDKNIGTNMYYRELGSIANKEQIVLILTALYRSNRPMLIFTERDANMEFCILEIFARFIYNSFGIVAGPYPQGPSYNVGSPIFNFNIADLLYTSGAINSMEYAMIKPEEAVPSDEALGLLLREINYGFGPDTSYTQICMSYLRDLKCEKLTGKKSPLIIVKDRMEEKRREQTNQMIMNSPTRFG